MIIVHYTSYTNFYNILIDIRSDWGSYLVILHEAMYVTIH